MLCPKMFFTLQIQCQPKLFDDNTTYNVIDWTLLSLEFAADPLFPADAIFLGFRPKNSMPGYYKCLRFTDLFRHYQGIGN